MATYPDYARLGSLLNAFRLGHLEPGAIAILDARSGIARSNASRSDYYSKLNILISIGGRDYSQYIRHGSLTIHQALNEEPDTCGFTLIPQVPYYPAIGDEVQIGIGAISNVEFGGRIVTVQHRREQNLIPPFLNILCTDWLPDFDQRIVSYQWVKQSATITIQDLVARFCQHNPNAQFTTDRVVADLPVIEAFSVVNQRPSDVMRKIAGALQGGFYVGPRRDVHAWAGAMEPGVKNPRTLSLDSLSLKQFQHTEDSSQVRTILVVEGARTTALAGLPNTPTGHIQEGFPIADSTLFRSAPGTVEIRCGSQRLMAQAGVSAFSPVYDPALAKGGKTNADAVPTDYYVILYFDDLSWMTGRPAIGWAEIDGRFQYFYAVDIAAKYLAFYGTKNGWGGTPTSTIKAGTQVTLVDWVQNVTGTDTPIGSPIPYSPIAAQPIGADVVLVVRKQAAPTARTWALPTVEHLITDGRYNYQGAVERATVELENFDHVAIAAQWETDDPNASPGRSQNVVLGNPDPLSAVFTITAVDLVFPVSNRAPRRTCTGGEIKRANLLDLLLTDRG